MVINKFLLHKIICHVPTSMSRGTCVHTGHFEDTPPAYKNDRISKKVKDKKLPLQDPFGKLFDSNLLTEVYLFVIKTKKP